jgi:ADP-heptose:LPS heptosyltransferase
MFDVFFDCRYVVRGYWNTNAFPRWKARSEFEYERFSYYWKNFVTSNALIQNLGLDWFALSSLTMGVPFSSRDLVMPVEKFSVPFKDKDYITIHCGLGNERGWTKTYPPAHWLKVVKMLSGQNIVQLGGKAEQNLALPGVFDLRGKTNFRQSAYILSRAKAHIDTEGGIVHMARAVNTPSVVLFGSTPIKFFGYEQNINLRSGACQNCWHSTPNWYVSCPKKKALKQKGVEIENVWESDCMRAISPEMVVDVTLKLIGGR